VKGCQNAKFAGEADGVRLSFARPSKSLRLIATPKPGCTLLFLSMIAEVRPGIRRRGKAFKCVLDVEGLAAYVARPVEYRVN
jgi:hypothetical protein